MSTEDPFGIFGDDDEDSDNNEVDEESVDVVRSMARSLVAQANDMSSKGQTPNNQAVANKDHSLKEMSSQEIRVEDGNKLSLPWPNPSYVNPSAILVSSLDEYGGGRGYIAQTLMRAGALIMIEEALVTWPTDNMDVDLKMILFLLQKPNAAEILATLQHLHPTLTIIDEVHSMSDEENKGVAETTAISSSLQAQVKDMMDEYDKALSVGEGAADDPIEHMLLFAKEINIQNADKTALSRQDILRILVALRYNSLETGIYLHVAMLNHADVPNCVKFKSSGLSEVRAIRDIQPGESLTISYLPQLLSHATRRYQLWHHHRFDIGATIPTTKVFLYEMELIGNRFPTSSIICKDGNNDNSIQYHIEATITELEEELREIILHGTQQKDGSSVTLPTEELERAKALEMAVGELCHTAEQQLQNDRYILLLPCRQLHLHACDLVLQQQQSIGLSTMQHMALFGRLIATCLHLWQLQENVYGPDHFNLAQTFMELYQAVEQVLSTNANFLTSTTLHDTIPSGIVQWLDTKHTPRLSTMSLSTISAWASLEHFSRTQHQRIKALYPRDAGQYLQQK